MADKPVTDPELLKLLNGDNAAPVSDPEVLRQLNGGAAKPVWSGSVLPVSKDASGAVHFDSNAGILGMAKGIVNSGMRVFQTPHDVYSGKIDPKSDEGIARAAEMATWLSPTGAATRAGSKFVPGASLAVKPGEAAVPTQQQLKDAAQAGYTRMRALGVDYAPEAVAERTGEIGRQLATGGFTERTAPNTVAVLRELANGPKPGPGDKVIVPLSGLADARAELGAIAGGGDRDAAGAKVAKRLIEDFIQNPPEKGVVAGPASEASRELFGASSNYAAAKRSEDISGIGTRQQRRAAAANSGQNIDNAIRSRVASTLDKLEERNGGGYTPAELAALDQIVTGTKTRNIAREIGNLGGGGGGLGMTALSGMGGALGALGGGAPWAAVGAVAPPIAGRLAKMLANGLTERELAAVDALTRKRSSLYEEMAKNPPMVPTGDPEMRTALIRALMVNSARPSSAN